MLGMVARPASFPRGEDTPFHRNIMLSPSRAMHGAEHAPAAVTSHQPDMRQHIDWQKRLYAQYTHIGFSPDQQRIVPVDAIEYDEKRRILLKPSVPESVWKVQFFTRYECMLSLPDGTIGKVESAPRYDSSVYLDRELVKVYRLDDQDNAELAKDVVGILGLTELDRDHEVLSVSCDHHFEKVGDEELRFVTFVTHADADAPSTK
jgi:hypothetical protein